MTVTPPCGSRGIVASDTGPMFFAVISVVIVLPLFKAKSHCSRRFTSRRATIANKSGDEYDEMRGLKHSN